MNDNFSNNTNEQIEQPNIINQNLNDNQRKTNTFNLIIGIATLLIALLGATFAYFSATARSAENDVRVKSAYVSITYDDAGTQIKATNLIPSSLTVALNKYQKSAETFTPDDENPINEDYDNYTNDTSRRCVDSKGREVCYVYQFSVTSEGIEEGSTKIIGAISINKNEFDNLSYDLFEVELDKDENGFPKKDKFGINIVKTNKGTPVGVNYRTLERDLYKGDPSNLDSLDQINKFEVFAKPVEISDGNSSTTTKPIACLFGYVDGFDELSDEDKNKTEKACKELEITNQEKHTYQLLVWLEENGVVQPEQGLSFEGTVSIEVVGAFGNEGYSDGKITGQQ